MWLFLQRAKYLGRKDEKGLNDFVNEQMGGQANVDVLWREMLRLLEEEIATVKAAFAEEVKAQEEKDAIERDACLAPAGETWEMLLRQEAGLDRSIDRKVRILLTMRKEHAQQCRGGSRTAPAQQEASPPDNETNDREAEELRKLVGLEAGADTPSSVCDPRQGSEAPRSLRETQTPKGRGLRQPTNSATGSPKGENTAETPKSPEQSENVIENKGPAAEAVSTT
jgi:hypothetical protein